MRGIRIILCLLFFLLCACEREVAENPYTVQIVDSHVDTSGQVLQYLDVATLGGAVEVEINGHTWRFYDPFHSSLKVDFDALPVSTFVLFNDCEDSAIRAWVLEHSGNWIRYVPAPNSDSDLFWRVVDTLENMGVPYWTQSVGFEGVGRLEALVTEASGAR